LLLLQMEFLTSQPEVFARFHALLTQLNHESTATATAAE